MRMIYFRKLHADVTDRLLPIDDVEQVFPEDILGQWNLASNSAEGHGLTVTFY